VQWEPGGQSFLHLLFLADTFLLLKPVASLTLAGSPLQKSKRGSLNDLSKVFGLNYIEGSGILLKGANMNLAMGDCIDINYSFSVPVSL